MYVPRTSHSQTVQVAYLNFAMSGDTAAGPLDGWIDLSAESERVRVNVEEMIRKMPPGMVAEVTRFNRRRMVSQLCVIFAKSVLRDEEKQVSELDDCTTHVVGAGTTQIYKTVLPATAALAGKNGF